MPAPLIAALTVALAAFAALARPRWAFATVVGATVLVPDTLALPNSLTSVLSVHLVVALGAFAGLWWRSGDRRIPGSIWHPSPASLALAGYLLVVLVVGLALAPPGLQTTPAVHRAIDLLQELLVLVVCTALVRTDGRPLTFVAPVVSVLFVSAGIGAVEHFTDGSWDHFLFSRLPSQSGTAAATGLQVRAGQVRVRAGADFALSYAAVLVAMLPLAIVAALRASRAVRRVLWIAAGIGVLVVVYWSGTRSAFAVFAVMLVALGLLSGRRSIAITSIVVLVLAVAAVLTLPVIGQHFSVGVDPGSIAVRQQRLPVVLDAVAQHPYTGLGLSGLSSLGISDVDSSYLLAYGETGAVGVAALLAALIAAMLAVARGLRAKDLQSRVLVAAVLAGMLAVLTSGIALDAFDLPSVADVFWELAALGVVTAEIAVGPVRLLRGVRALVLAPVAAGALGALGLAFAPSSQAVTYNFDTLPAITDAGAGDLAVTGDQLIATACAAFVAEAQQQPGHLSVSCRNPYGYPGQGTLRIEAASAASIEAALPHLVVAAGRAGVPTVDLLTEQPLTTGRPSGLVTLPAALAVFSLILAFALPLGRIERRLRPMPRWLFAT